MRRSVRRAVGVGMAVGTLGLAFSGTAFGVVGTSPIPTYQANGRVQVITVANGTVYIGGTFTSVRPAGSGGSSTTRNHVAAFNEATGALLPWNPNVSGNVRAIEIVGSTAYLGGSFTRVGTASRRNLAAVDASSGGRAVLEPQRQQPGARHGPDQRRALRGRRLHHRERRRTHPPGGVRHDDGRAHLVGAVGRRAREGAVGHRGRVEGHRRRRLHPRERDVAEPHRGTRSARRAPRSRGRPMSPTR